MTARNLKRRMEIGNAIRRARRAAGLRQQDLGAKLDPPLAQSTIAHLESGAADHTVTVLADIAKAVGVSKHDLICGAHDAEEASAA